MSLTTKATRLLPWTYEKPDAVIPARVETQVYNYSVVRTYEGRFSPVRIVGVNWIPMIITTATLDEAISACESDYIARCTEFLRVAGPGECVVKVEDAIEMATTICALCNKAGICPGLRMIPTTLCIVSRLCAAIDAASKE